MLRCFLLVLVSAGVTGSCPRLESRRRPPSTVDDLRIDDFKVVMAMGDSMTAGFNAVRPDLKEYRGVSFSVGGDENAVTLPNFINAIKSSSSKSLVGASTGYLSQPTVKGPCSGTDIDRSCHLNAAVDGSDLQNLIEMQVSYLRNTLDHAPWASNVSSTEDWKLLTIFSGLDDVVFYNVTNQYKNATSPALLAANLNSLLEAIYQSLPRTYVNLLVLPERFDPKETTARLSCKFFKWYSEHAGIHWTDTSTWTATIAEYNHIFKDVVAQWRAKGLKDFAVVLQPFLQKTQLSGANFDTADCFHPNLVTHQGMATGLWNNMLAAAQEDKDDIWSANATPGCPTVMSRLVV